MIKFKFPNPSKHHPIAPQKKDFGLRPVLPTIRDTKSRTAEKFTYKRHFQKPSMPKPNAYFEFKHQKLKSCRLESETPKAFEKHFKIDEIAQKN